MFPSPDRFSLQRHRHTRLHRSLRESLAAAALGLTLGLTTAPDARAATLNVPCSAAALTSAIATVNANGEEDFVWLAPACTYTLPATWTVAYDGGNPLRIYGSGATLSGGDARLPLSVDGGAIAFVEGLTIQDGANNYEGGGIRTIGVLTLTGVTVTDNAATGWGGGIYSGGGSLRILSSTVSGNHAVWGGGAIDNDGTARLTLVGSAVTSNVAPYGGGIRNEHMLLAANSTFHDNFSDLGGALLNEQSGLAALSAVTVSGNRITLTGGSSIHNDGVLAVNGSVLANTNAGNADCANYGVLTATGPNLVEDGSCALAGAISGDPKLGSPAGKPAALALLSGSPALDAGASDRCPGTDQGGWLRPRDGNKDGAAACDLGAVENQPGGACGLLGIEPFLVLAFVRRAARRLRRAPGAGPR
jgi:hypothetical protein